MCGVVSEPEGECARSSMDRAVDFESARWGFDSLRAYELIEELGQDEPVQIRSLF